MWDSSSISTLFSSVGSSRSNSSSSLLSNIDLGTYSSIKKGSYGKLLKAYYSNNLDSKASSLVSSAKSSTSTASDSTKTLSSIKSAAGDMIDSAKNLYKKGIGDDTDEAYTKVKAFVDNYNSLISAADDSNTKNITNSLESMESLTKSNSKSLAKIGITADSSTGKLSIDEKTFKKSNMSSISSLFEGNGSYAYGVASKASMMEHYAKSEASKSNTYSSSGSYSSNYTEGSNYSSYT